MRQGVKEKVGFCYVHHENVSIRAVMKSQGWRKSEENVMWDLGERAGSEELKVRRKGLERLYEI
jgi:hypothetical protein